MVTMKDIKQQHKELKKRVQEAENTRRHVRDWKTKEELVNLKKEKLIAKDKLKNNQGGL
jgi:uncharacterized protein YdcH (DUF465 family)